MKLRWIPLLLVAAAGPVWQGCPSKKSDIGAVNSTFANPTELVAPLTFKTIFLDVAQVNKALAIQVQIEGGKGPFKFDSFDATNTFDTFSSQSTVPGPGGIAIDGTTGLITGIPAQSGNFTVTIGVTEEWDPASGNAPGQRHTITLPLEVKPETTSAVPATTPSIFFIPPRGLQRGSIPLTIRFSDPNPGDESSFLIDVNFDTTVATNTMQPGHFIDASGTATNQTSSYPPGTVQVFWDALGDEAAQSTHTLRVNAATGAGVADVRLTAVDLNPGLPSTPVLASTERFLTIDNVPLPVTVGAERQYSAGCAFVLGQANAQSVVVNSGGSCGTGHSTLHLSTPYDVATDGVRLVVADRDNHRVLIWNSVAGLTFGTAGTPTAALISASPPNVVLGQPDINSNCANQNSKVDEDPITKTFLTTLNSPSAVEIHDGRIFVADTGNNRVLVWNTIPTVSNTSADLVLGQKAMGLPTADKMNAPEGVSAWDDMLFVADTRYHRVQVFTISQLSSTNGPDPSYVLGAESYAAPVTSGGLDSGPRGMRNPTDVLAVDGMLYVADRGNNRVLGWNSVPTVRDGNPNGRPADFVIGQAGFNAVLANQGTGAPSATSLNTPSNLATDGHRLIVSDTANNRVLFYDGFPKSSGRSAKYVVGAPDLKTLPTPTPTNPTGGGFFQPHGLVVNNGRLFVADSNFHRLLGFK